MRFWFPVMISLIIASAVAARDTKAPSESVVIHYGLNDSHSKSWVREDDNGVVGITYFQRFEGDYTNGTLYYKTIQLDGSETLDSVTSGSRMEKSVLLFDSLSNPHIFVARSNDADQIIEQYARNDDGQWVCDTITHFYGEGGKFIYELSADSGPDHSFHLLILKTRSDIDSDDFIWAWLGSYLYHMTNASGSWQVELVYDYDMAYTYDHYVKSSCRQDIKVGKDGVVHVTFSEQINGTDDPSRLMYATNKYGIWQVEVALNYISGSRDDAGWYPSLCLDNDGVPCISCMYVKRVYTHSATFCRLLLLKRRGPYNWSVDTVAGTDDGYYGSDGRTFTGALIHLVFDKNNTPHIIFSDIASSHWPVYQRLNVGNIRYAVLEDSVWNIRTIFRQPLPIAFLTAIEMYGMCLNISEKTDTVRVIGVELIVSGEFNYRCKLLEFAWAESPTDVDEETGASLPDQYRLFQNRPNPFNPGTSIEFDLPRRSRVTVSVFNVLGEKVNTLVDDELPAGRHSVDWNGIDSRGETVATGIYFYRLQTGNYVETKKMVLLN